MTAPRIPPEALEGLMKKAFQELTVDAGLFWDALLNAHLIVPLAPSDDAIEAAALPGNGEKRLPVLLGVDSDGNHVVWLFTSVEVMTEYTERELRYTAMSAPDLLKSVSKSEHDVVLIGPEGLTLNLHRDLMASLAEGKVPEQPAEEVRTIPKDASVYVGKPSADPTALESKFRELFQNLPDVLEACFIQIADDAGERLLLGLRLQDQSREHFRRIAGLVAKASEGVLEKGKTMDITLMDKSLKDAFEKWGTPFFKRENAE